MLALLIVSMGASVRADSDVIVDKLNKKIDNITLKDADGGSQARCSGSIFSIFFCHSPGRFV